MAHIYQDKNHGTWYISFSRNGRRVRQALHTKNKREARLVLAQFDLGLASQLLNEPVEMPFCDVVGEFLKSRRDLAPDTRAWYKDRLKRFEGWLADGVMLDEMNAPLLMQYRQARADKVSAGTVAADMRALTVLFTWAVECGYLQASPMTRNIRRVPRQQKQSRIALSVAERAVYEKKLRGHPLYGVFLFGCHAGLRRGEMTALERGDIRDGVLEVTNKPELGFTLKDYEARRVPIESELSDFIGKLPRSGPAFPTPRGCRWNGDNLTALWRATMRELKLPPNRSGKWGITLHELRHTYASIQVQEKGVDIFTLMRRLGHSSITTTQIYFHQFNP